MSKNLWTFEGYRSRVLELEASDNPYSRYHEAHTAWSTGFEMAAADLLTHSNMVDRSTQPVGQHGESPILPNRVTGLPRGPACICDRSPETTDGPSIDCEIHGLPDDQRVWTLDLKVNGKRVGHLLVRDRNAVDDIKARARAAALQERVIVPGEIRRIIYVPGKLVNIITVKSAAVPPTKSWF